MKFRRSLPTGKASGPDSINNNILKDFTHLLSTPLKDRFNLSLKKGQVPAVWKQDNVTPIFKKTIFQKCQTIGQSLFLVPLERLLKKLFTNTCLTSFMKTKFLLLCSLRFVPGDSTVNQLTDLYNTFCHALDEGKEVNAVFCDISKASDRV